LLTEGIATLQRKIKLVEQTVARTWLASDFGAYANDCLDDWKGFKKAIDSAYKLWGLTILVLDSDWFEKRNGNNLKSLLFQTL